MKVLDYSRIEKFYVLGDVHGEFKALFNTIKRELTKNSIECAIHPKEQERIAQRLEKQRLHQARIEMLNQNDEDEDDNTLEVHVNEYDNDDVLLEDYNVICKTVCKYESSDSKSYDDSVIIIAGDCGFGFNSIEYYNQLITKFNSCLEANNCHLLFVRGNHDDPKYFSEELINFSNIKTIQDYTVVKIKDKNVLCVGGGLSVDRVWRWEQEDYINRFVKTNRKKLYWDGEMPIINEEEIELITKSELLIDVVITHTAPSFCYPEIKLSSMSWLGKDKDLKDDIKIERESLDELYNLLKKYKHNVKVWCYGHFHEEYENIYEETCFKLCSNNFTKHDIFRLLAKLNVETSIKLKVEDYSWKIQEKLNGLVFSPEITTNGLYTNALIEHVRNNGVGDVETYNPNITNTLINHTLINNMYDDNQVHRQSNEIIGNLGRIRENAEENTIQHNIELLHSLVELRTQINEGLPFVAPETNDETPF